MSRRNRTPEENERREKVRELLQLSGVKGCSLYAGRRKRKCKIPGNCVEFA